MKNPFVDFEELQKTLLGIISNGYCDAFDYHFDQGSNYETSVYLTIDADIVRCRPAGTEGVDYRPVYYINADSFQNCENTFVDDDGELDYEAYYDYKYMQIDEHTAEWKQIAADAVDWLQDIRKRKYY